MTNRVVVRRIEDRLVKEGVGHKGGPKTVGGVCR
jgi:hypothetical protein